MKKRYRHVSAYLDDATFVAISSIAKKQRTTVSTLMRSLIQREVEGSNSRDDELRRTQEAILIGVNALVKHHTNPQLFEIVKLTQASVLGSASDGR